jgi:hypothetical protein
MLRRSKVKERKVPVGAKSTQSILLVLEATLVAVRGKRSSFLLRHVTNCPSILPLVYYIDVVLKNSY